MYDVVIIGEGPAGMSATIKAKELGMKVFLIEDKENFGGNIVFQDFIEYEGEKISPKEFVRVMREKIEKLGISYALSSTALEISKKGAKKNVLYVSPDGIFELETKSIIYAAGAREKHRFELGILGDRVAGIYTAREAIKIIEHRILPGKEIVIGNYGGIDISNKILNSGAKIKAIIDSKGRNSKIDGVKVYNGYKILEIHGKNRVEKVIIGKMEGEEKIEIKCDSVILSTPCVPRIKLLKKLGVQENDGIVKVDENLETNVKGVFIAGAALHPDESVEEAVKEGERAAKFAKSYVCNF